MFSRAQWGYVDLFSAHSIATRCAGPGRGLITEWSCVANSGYVCIRQWQLHAAGSLASPNGNTRILSFSYLRNKPRWIVCHRFRTWLNQSRPWILFFHLIHSDWMYEALSACPSLAPILVWNIHGWLIFDKIFSSFCHLRSVSVSPILTIFVPWRFILPS